MWGAEFAVRCEVLHVLWGLLLYSVLLPPTLTTYRKLSEAYPRDASLIHFSLLWLYFSLAVLWHILEDYTLNWF